MRTRVTSWLGFRLSGLFATACLGAGCMTCPTGQFPVNFKCQAHDCPAGTSPQSLDDGSIQCTCSAGEHWIDGKCKSWCPVGQTWGYTGDCCRPITNGNIDINTCMATPPPGYNIAVGPHRI